MGDRYELPSTPHTLATIDGVGGSSNNVGMIVLPLLMQRAVGGAGWAPGSDEPVQSVVNWV